MMQTSSSTVITLEDDEILEMLTDHLKDLVDISAASSFEFKYEPPHYPREENRWGDEQIPGRLTISICT
jgi:hypothetical protein